MQNKLFGIAKLHDLCRKGFQRAQQVAIEVPRTQATHEKEIAFDFLSLQRNCLDVCIVRIFWITFFKSSATMSLKFLTIISKMQ